MALTRGLVARGHDTLVAVLQGGGVLVPELHAAQVNVYEATPRGIRALPLQLPRLVAVLRRWQPDVLHAYLPSANVFALLLRPLLRKTPTVLGVRTIAPERDPRDRGVRILYRAETIAARFADAVIANSSTAREHIVARGFPPERVHAIPNGIDTDQFRFDRNARSDLRAEWSIGQDEVLVGRIGRMRPNKDYPSFLRAAAEAAKRCPNLRFVCVGDGPQRGELEYLARDLGLGNQLGWTGERDDISAVMSALDVLVSSSQVESFPNVIGEAMACGVPCAVTDAGDSSVIVGDTGIVVPTEAPDELANAIVDLAGRIPVDRQVVRARITGEFGVDRMVVRTEQLLTHIIMSRGT